MLLDATSAYSKSEAFPAFCRQNIHGPYLARVGQASRWDRTVAERASIAIEPVFGVLTRGDRTQVASLVVLVGGKAVK